MSAATTVTLDAQKAVVADIVTTRQAELDALQKTADQTAFQQSREAQIEQNKKDRLVVQTHATVAAAVTLGIIFVCILVRVFMPVIPLFVTSAIILIAICGGLVLVGRDLILLNSRDPSNFQELHLPTPPETDKKGVITVPTPAPTTPPATGTTPSPSGTGTTCVGSACCDGVNNTWNAAQGKCCAKSVEGFFALGVRRPGLYPVPAHFNPKPFQIDVGNYESIL